MSLSLDRVQARTIEHLARWFQTKGWVVRTRLPGWGLPPRVDGHLPDLYASDGEREVAIDVSRPALVDRAAHRVCMRNWQRAAPDRRRYAVEPVHESGVNRTGPGPARWSRGDGRGFW